MKNDEPIIDPQGFELNVGDRVCAFDLDGHKYEGILLLNSDHPHVSKYYVKYDDGNECDVLDLKLIWKA